MADRCEHLSFGAEVAVHRLMTEDGQTCTGYMADVRIRCVQCQRPFQFLGLQPGVDTRGATMSVDALEAHLALCPEGAQPSPLGAIAAIFKPDRTH